MATAISRTTNYEREQLACEICEPHVKRIVVCTPSKIVFEVTDAQHAAQAQAKLQAEGFSTEVFDGQFLHARY